MLTLDSKPSLSPEITIFHSRLLGESSTQQSEGRKLIDFLGGGRMWDLDLSTETRKVRTP